MCGIMASSEGCVMMSLQFKHLTVQLQ